MTLLQPIEMSPKAENGDKWSQISNTAVIKRKLQKAAAQKFEVSDKSFSSEVFFFVKLIFDPFDKNKRQCLLRFSIDRNNLF